MGSAGSGNFGHGGRPGQRGGSTPGYHGTASQNAMRISKTGLRPGTEGVFMSSNRTSALEYGIEKAADHFEGGGEEEFYDKATVALVIVKNASGSSMKVVPAGGSVGGRKGETYFHSKSGVSAKQISRVEIYRVKDIANTDGTMKSESVLKNVKPFKITKRFGG